MGIDLTGGTQIGPAAPKLLALLGAVIDLVGHRNASPCEVSSMLGVIQWFDLLNRWMLSCLHSVYGFCREGCRPPPHTPPTTAQELKHQRSTAARKEALAALPPPSAPGAATAIETRPNHDMAPR